MNATGKFQIMAKATTWTDERINLLKQFWGQKSAAEIAKILGNGLSRNAVIGKAHRLNLSAGKKPANTSISTIRERARSASNKERARLPRVLRSSKPAVQLPPEPVSLNLSLLQLTEKICRYPHGDPKEHETFSFCGTPSLPGLPYCSYHAAVAYQINTKRDIAEPVERERPAEEDEGDLNNIVRA